MIKQHHTHKKNKGFSIVELIVVIAVMAILAAIAIPTFSYLIRKANEAADIRFMTDLEYAIHLANADSTSAKPIARIIVTINTDDGSIEQITHETIDPNEFGKVYQPDQDTFHRNYLAIDWNYKFKALDSVDDNPNWKGSWFLIPYTPPDPTASPGSYD